MYVNAQANGVGVSAMELPDGTFDVEVAAGDVVKTFHFQRAYRDATEQDAAKWGLSSLVSALWSRIEQYDPLRSELAPHVGDIVRMEREMAGYPISDDEVARRVAAIRDEV